MPSEHEGNIIQAVQTCTGFISVVACIYMGMRIYRERRANIANSMLSFLFLLDSLLAICYAVGRSALTVEGLCQIQGLVIQWCSLAAILWTVLMAYKMRQWIVRNKHPKRIEASVRSLMSVIAVISGLMAIALVSAGTIGPAYLWCWIEMRYENVRLGCFDMILFISWAMIAYYLSEVGVALRARWNRSASDLRLLELLSSYPAVQKKLFLYVSIFVVVWFFAVLNRLVEWSHGHPVFITSLLEVLILPLQGALNAVAFGDLFGVVSAMGIKDKSSTSFVLHEQIKPTHQLREVLVESPHSQVPMPGPTANNNGATTSASRNPSFIAAPLYGPGTSSSLNSAGATAVAASASSWSAPTYIPKQYSIFTSTMNLGEAPLARMLAEIDQWILPGHDVYAIGVQECLELVGLSEAILAYLNGKAAGSSTGRVLNTGSNNNSGSVSGGQYGATATTTASATASAGGVGGEEEAYTLFTTSIGSGNTTLGYHGYIALMLFVRNADLKAGSIVPTVPSTGTVATGKNLIVTTAQNKGAVGLSLQIHDSSICFVTCHLPSDSKGKSKLSKRNASAHSILKEVILAPEDVGFDLHLQHDHVMVFGDMNYRMDSKSTGGGMGSLSGVAVSCVIEKNALNNDPKWLQRRYNLLRSPSDPLFPNRDELKLIKQARSQAKGAWSSVLRADELRAIMGDGDAFCGFFEPMPAFPPSYKRKTGNEAGECGDYTDPLQIIQGYTNTGEVQDIQLNNDADDSDRDSVVSAEAAAVTARKLRPPSYTDRILIHALPDRQQRLAIQAYDFCDRLRVSDHRAVSMAVRLDVNRAVSFHNHSTQAALGRNKQKTLTPANGASSATTISSNSNSSGTAVSKKKDIEQGSNDGDSSSHVGSEPHFHLYELSIARMSVRLVSRLEEAEAEEDSDDDDDDSDLGSSGHGGSSSLDSSPDTSTRKQLASAGRPPLLKQNSRASAGGGVDGDFIADSMGPYVTYSATTPAAAASSSSSSIAPSTASPPSSPSRAAAAESPAADNVNPMHGSRQNSKPFSPSSLSTAEAGESAPKASSPPRASPAVAPVRPSPAPTSRGGGGGGGRGGGLLRRLSSAVSSSSSSPASPSSASASSSSSRPRPARKQSIFVSLGKSMFNFKEDDSEDEDADEDDKDDEEDLSGGSLDWTGDESQKGEWKKKLREEAEARKLARKNKKRSQKIAAKLKKKRKALRNDKQIARVVVVFPLPSKDPLLSHRKLFDFSHAFDLRGDAGEVGEEEEMWMQGVEDDDDGDGNNNNATGARRISSLNASHALDQRVTKEQLLRPLSVFKWKQRPTVEEQPNPAVANKTKAAASTAAAGMSNGDSKEVAGAVVADTKGASNGSAANVENGMAGQLNPLNSSNNNNDNNNSKDSGMNNRSSISTTGSNSSDKKKKIVGVTSATKYHVIGCASRELGAHVLVKFLNPAGYELGSAVICISQLLHQSLDEIKATEFKDVTISSGGQKRGTLSGKFSLKFLPSLLSQEMHGV